MQKVFYLKICGTCSKIISKFDLSSWELRELKSSPLKENELAEMYQHTNSYEALFSKRSSQIKLREIEVKNLVETDFKNLLLDHYSFLKRPVFLTKDQIFIGNDKKNIHNLEQFFNN